MHAPCMTSSTSGSGRMQRAGGGGKCFASASARRREASDLLGVSSPVGSVVGLLLLLDETCEASAGAVDVPRSPRDGTTG